MNSNLAHFSYEAKAKHQPASAPSVVGFVAFWVK
jgi:hypothetical protein